MKSEHFDRLIVKGGDGSTIVLDHLGQAVFPLQRFFGWLLLRAEAAKHGIPYGESQVHPSGAVPP
jgi:hypothetical protein